MYVHRASDERTQDKEAELELHRIVGFSLDEKGGVKLVHIIRRAVCCSVLQCVAMCCSIV